MDIAADIATIVASCVAVAALLIGLSQFRATQQQARENLRLQEELLKHEQNGKAVDLFLRFNEEKSKLSSLEADSEEAFWSHNSLFTLTESVYKLTVGDKQWEETIVWMLDLQRDFLEEHPVKVSTFAPPFIELVRKVVPNLNSA